MVKIYYEEDADLAALEDKTVAVIGYGNQGAAQAKCMRDSGANVIIGVRKDGSSWHCAKEDDFDVYTIQEAAEEADVIHILIPDEVQPTVYREKIADSLVAGNTLGFAHGFNIHFRQIAPPNFVDVVMVAPKAPGSRLREQYREGSGVPALVAVEQDHTGNAIDTALAMAKAIGSTRIGVIATTFQEETETDLFGEQVDLCGGITELIKAAFETLVEAGYQPEICYFETLHELKLIIDLIYKKGLTGMWDNVSNTATYGGLTRGKNIINEQSRKAMAKVLEDIKSGKFAEEWINEYNTGLTKFNKLLEQEKKHQIEKVGKKLRKMAGIAIK